MKKHKKAPRWLGNVLYLICLPVIAIIVIWMLFSVLDGRKDDIKENFKNESQGQAQIQNQIIYDSGEKNVLNIGGSSQKPSLEDIVSQELNSVMQENGYEVESSSSLINEGPPSDPLATDLDSDVVIDYSNFTLSDIVEKGTEEVKDDSFLAKDLAIKYTESRYKGVTKDGAFVLEVNNEDKYVYLTGVNVFDAQPIADLMYGVENVYIEYDINTKRGAGEQAYLWLIPPDNDKKESMINCIVLENGWGSYTDPMPNIKYQYYFLKIKP